LAKQRSECSSLHVSGHCSYHVGTPRHRCVNGLRDYARSRAGCKLM
jgi:hypothetical protein